jgi:predicted component of type VI protein secretion system
MALELRIAGPGLDVARRLEPGQPPLVLGRDAECAVCLPDPQRNVSRRHLSVWNEGNELHFHVLSVVNGVDMPFGEAPPGARGVLPIGQTLKIAEYSLTVEAAAGADKEDADPWAALDKAASMTTPLRVAPMKGEADPFGDWGFETTFGADMPGAGGLQASGLQMAEDISAFYRGLGLDPAKVGALSQGELEAIGRLVRQALVGVMDMHRTTAGLKKDLRAEDRTMLAPKEKNPLKESGWDDDTVLQYLFGGRVASVGFIGPERAMRELMADLQIHEKATAAAARAAVEGTLAEFEPEALKGRLLGGGARLFESARAWDAFARHYGEQKGADAGAWAQRLMDKYFTEAYVRETVRAKPRLPS